jgi:hypothetical protein
MEDKLPEGNVITVTIAVAQTLEQKQRRERQ